MCCAGNCTEGSNPSASALVVLPVTGSEQYLQYSFNN